MPDREQLGLEMQTIFDETEIEGRRPQELEG
jgi:hypothetical protein